MIIEIRLHGDYMIEDVVGGQFNSGANTFNQFSFLYLEFESLLVVSQKQ